MAIKAILQRAGIALLLATATLAAPAQQERDTVTTNLAVYDSCDSDVISQFESYIPDQTLLASEAVSALNFLEQNLDERDLSKTIALGFGHVDLSTLRELIVRFFGKDAIPALSVGTDSNSNGTIAQSTEPDNQVRLENFRGIRDVYEKVHKVLANKPIIVCRDACEQSAPGVAFIDLECELGSSGTRKCPYPPGVPYVNVCPAEFSNADALKPFHDVLTSFGWDSVGDVTGSFWRNVEISASLIHEITHIQPFGSRDQTLILDQRPLVNGAVFCDPYWLGGTQVMAEADSYLAMRNADNYAQFSVLLAVSASNLIEIPTKESFISSYMSTCTPINSSTSGMKKIIMDRLFSVQPGSWNQTYGEVWPKLNQLFQDFPG